MEFEKIEWSVQASPLNPEDRCIGLIKLNAPEKLNAIGPQMSLELDYLCDRIRRREDIQIVVVTGTDPAFCAGGDLQEESGGLQVTGADMGLKGPYAKMMEYYVNDVFHVVMQNAVRKLEDLPQVTIAAVNGAAVGVGLEMTTGLDLRIASEKAKMGEVAVVAGFLPETGGCRNLPKLVGYGRAMELTLTGRILTAREALEIGLVEFVVPHEKLLDEAFQLAGRIAQGPRISVREAKRLMKSYWDSNKTDAGFKDELDTVLEITRTPDCREGIRAFLNKERPKYTGAIS